MSDSKAFSAIYLSVGLSYLGVGLVAPLIPILLGEHGENSFLVGLIGSTMFAAFTLASFPVGALTDRIGPKPVLLGGLMVYGIAILLFAFINQTSLFFVVRAIEGVGASAISVATETMINRLSEHGERARKMSYYALSVGIGWAAGPETCALLFGIRPSVPFIGCFALSMIAALLAGLLIRNAPPGSNHGEHVFSVLS